MAGNFTCSFSTPPGRSAIPSCAIVNASIGHATSSDLRTWRHHGVVLRAGAADAFDATATWTGSVVRGPDGLWRMFYTGSRFLSPESVANVETIGLATSPDLFSWSKAPAAVLAADPRWYETLGTSSWPEEAWRDPWVFRDPARETWHMLVTARANHGSDFGRGVVGHAISNDLATWRALPPISAPQSGFAHLEVPQMLELEGRWLLLFCCNAARLANQRQGSRGGVWMAPAEGPAGPVDAAAARLVLPERYYAGRAVEERDGSWALMAFVNEGTAGGFTGTITDPMPLRLDAGGEPAVLDAGRSR